LRASLCWNLEYRKFCEAFKYGSGDPEPFVQMVTEVRHGKPGNHILGGGRRLSMGNSEDKYLLFGKLLEVNSNNTNSLEIQFYVEVDATGLEKDPVKIKSPLYKFKLNPPELETLDYW